MEQTRTIQDIITESGLSMTATSIPHRSRPMGDAEWDKTASHWLCTITRTGHAPMSIEYSMGSAHRRWKKGAGWNATRYGLVRSMAKPGERIGFGVKLPPGAIDDLTEPIPPTLPEILDCLASDASGYDNARSFSEWAEELGWSDDSIKAKACYDLTGEQAKQLRHLLGSEVYDQLLYHVDRL
jgi:hypothetical protein